MGKIAVVFSGQGAQYPGMGKSLYENSALAKALYDSAEEIRSGTMAQSFDGTEEELKITANTQPCLYLVDLAAALALRENGVEPSAVAGFSLGEVAALALERNTGARGLRSILEQAMTDMMFEIPSRPDIGEVRITAAFIRGTEPPLYLPRKEDTPAFLPEGNDTNI
jgi:malonyl CoA-acyl carrier protein transacylase